MTGIEEFFAGLGSTFGATAGGTAAGSTIGAAGTAAAGEAGAIAIPAVTSAGISAGAATTAGEIGAGLGTGLLAAAPLSGVVSALNRPKMPNVPGTPNIDQAAKAAQERDILMRRRGISSTLFAGAPSALTGAAGTKTLLGG